MERYSQKQEIGHTRDRASAKKQTREARNDGDHDNANNMVVLNGIGGKRAEHTYFDRKGDSDGIDDYIAVSGGMVHKTSHI